MSKKALIYFIGSIILLILVIALYGVWYSIVAAKSTQVAQIEEQLSEKNQTTAQIAQAKAELTSLSSDESTIDQYFVSTNNVVPFLEQLQATGKYLGSTVTVESVSATPGTPYGHLSLSLSISGSFNSVLRTLGAIEYGPYDTVVNSLTLDTDSGTTASSSQDWTATGVFSVGTQVGQPLVAPPTTVTTAAATSTDTNAATSTNVSTPAPTTTP